MTLGSLFDGSGGFPLAGLLAGIKPMWSSEIEPYPLRVTEARFPDVKQLGSVTDINGVEIEPVDIITFGSPCQDLSVAGKQLGIHEGQRSNLFFEAIRIIKEMRNADQANGRSGVDIRPRFAVWENVPGAFSSNKGADFKAVLEALAGVCENNISIPQPKRWDTGGGIVGNGWSIAWRVYDAQYWGVPQRRKRIYLVADFGSECAPEILFVTQGLRGDSAQGREAWEGTAADAERSVGGSGEPICLNFQGNKGGCSTTQDGTAYSLNAMHGHDVHVIVDKVKCLNPWDCQSKRQHDINGAYPTLQAYNGGGGRCDGVVYPINTMVATRSGKDDMRTCFGVGESGDPQFTISAAHEHGVCYALQGNGIDRADTAGCNGRGWRTDVIYTLNTIDRPVIAATAGSFMASGKDVSMTLMARDYKDPQYVCYKSDNNRTAVCIGNGQTNNISMKPLANTLDTMCDVQKAMYESDNSQRKYIVRRLTPLECCRLQGFPDWWEDGVEGSDSARYKMWGNGIALPCAYDVLNRIATYGGSNHAFDRSSK